jgi:hypothetical protein
MNPKGLLMTDLNLADNTRSWEWENFPRGEPKIGLVLWGGPKENGPDWRIGTEGENAAPR